MIIFSVSFDNVDCFLPVIYGRNFEFERFFIEHTYSFRFVREGKIFIDLFQFLPYGGFYACSK